MYGGFPYGGVAYAGSDVGQIPQNQTDTLLAVEVSFTTNPYDTPLWVDITPDVRSWRTRRGRTRELERFQPGSATVVLDNRSAQYDSLNTAGPYYGNLKPMKRMRIRETFNGVTYPVFDGYVDSWQINHPNAGLDSYVTLTATDGFKPLARSDLDRSVYTRVVKASAPVIWWRLDDGRDVVEGGLNAVNSGSAGSTHNGVVKGGLRFRDNGLIVNDDGYSVRSFNDDDTSGTHLMGLSIPNSTFSLLSQANFSVELWFIVDDITAGAVALVQWGVSRGADVSGHAAGGFVNDPTGPPARPNLIQFLVANAAFSDTRGVQTADNSVIAGKIYHLVCTKASDNTMTIYLNGVGSTTVAAGASANTWPATVPTNGDFCVGMSTRNGGIEQVANWRGLLSEVAVYTRALGAAEVLDHFNAGRAPWDNDSVATRIGRVLDASEWPAGRRQLDAGITTFQSAELGTTALEHALRASESEYASLFFMSREGDVRFIGRTAALAREPYPIAFSDVVGEVGYEAFNPDDGDASIRNRAKITRLNGAEKTSTDSTSTSAFGVFDYVLGGLFNRSDSESELHAFFITDQYGDQRRRVTSLDMTSPVTGTEAVAYPAMLGTELGNAITVKNTPIGGQAFSQVCAIEGIEHAGVPKGPRTCRLILSPEYPIRTLEDIDVATLGYAQVTANQTGITAETDLTGLTTTVTVGSSRRVRITGYVGFQKVTNTGIAALRIKESTTQLQDTFLDNLIANQVGYLCSSVVLTPSAGSHTYKLALAASTATVSMTASATAPSFILVEDIGPA